MHCVFARPIKTWARACVCVFHTELPRARERFIHFFWNRSGTSVIVVAEGRVTLGERGKRRTTFSPDQGTTGCFDSLTKIYESIKSEFFLQFKFIVFFFYAITMYELSRGRSLGRYWTAYITIWLPDYKYWPFDYLSGPGVIMNKINCICLCYVIGKLSSY